MIKLFCKPTLLPAPWWVKGRCLISYFMLHFLLCNTTHGVLLFLETVWPPLPIWPAWSLCLKCSPGSHITLPRCQNFHEFVLKFSFLLFEPKLSGVCHVTQTTHRPVKASSSPSSCCSGISSSWARPPPPPAEPFICPSSFKENTDFLQETHKEGCRWMRGLRQRLLRPASFGLDLTSGFSCRKQLILLCGTEF